MDFSVKNIWVLTVCGIEVWITQTMVNTWIIMVLLILFAVLVRIKLSGFKEIPAKFQNVIESLVEMFDNFLDDTVGVKLRYIGNWYFTVFTFILVSNLSGIVGFRPPTADWVTTFALAFATLIIIQIAGIRHRGFEYIKGFFRPIFFFLPLNLIGELARPISLSFRLYGNILAGLILMSLLYSIMPMVGRFVFPSFLHAYFDLFTGALQTYIFCVLSMTFVSAAASEG